VNDQYRPLIIAIVVLAAVFYLGGILWAGLASLFSTPGHSPQIPDIVTNAITAIGTLLATYFGAVFGITEASATRVRGPSSAFRYLLPNRWAWDRVSPHRGRIRGEGRSATPAYYKTIQTCAVYVYFLGLLVALAFLVVASLKGTVVADMLKNMVSALIGVIVGVLSLILNVK
jgi:hypothetical protein